MSYFKINDNDYSMYVSELSIGKEHNYNAQTNAAGNTVVDYVNSKREIEVNIIPLDAATMKTLQADIDRLEADLTFINPITNELDFATCIIPSNEVEYYTIQKNGRTMFKAFKIKFIEL